MVYFFLSSLIKIISYFFSSFFACVEVVFATRDCTLKVMDVSPSGMGTKATPTVKVHSCFNNYELLLMTSRHNPHFFAL